MYYEWRGVDHKFPTLVFVGVIAFTVHKDSLWLLQYNVGPDTDFLSARGGGGGAT